MSDPGKITINYGGSDDDRVDLVSDNLDDDMAASLLLQSYLQVARNILRDHNCKNAACPLKDSTIEMTASVIHTMTAYQLRHQD